MKLIRIVFIILIAISFVGLSTTLAIEEEPDWKFTPYPAPPPDTVIPSYTPSLSFVGGTFLLDEVPEYIWQHGCGPTATAMMLGFYDEKYGTNFFADTLPETLDLIASPEHYADYSLPDDTNGPILQDKSELGGAHYPNNCLADWMYTSWSSENNCYGQSWVSDLVPSIIDYADQQGYAAIPTIIYWNDGINFKLLQTELTAGRPFVIVVDVNGDSFPDHLVTALGWNEGPPAIIGIYTTWADQGIRWIPVKPLGNDWGIGAVVFTKISGYEGNLTCYQCNGTQLLSEPTNESFCPPGWSPIPLSCGQISNPVLVSLLPLGIIGLIGTFVVQPTRRYFIYFLALVSALIVYSFFMVV